ncbi:MAG: rod shape-determining protein MreD, partial [Pseudomonadota bacterium]
MSAKPSGLAIAVRALLLALAGLVAIAVEAAPLGLEPRALPSPDLLACLVACWAVRAPEAAALVLVFALGLVRDLLTDLPIGLGALTLVLLAEAMRLRAGRASGWSAFLLEWLWFALAAAAMLALQWLGVLIG